MKKTIALALALLMMFAVPLTCFAAEFGKQPASYDFSGNLSLALDITGDDAASAVPDSVAALLKDIAVSYTGTVIQDKSNMKAQIYFSSTVTTGSYDVPVKFWLDLDMSDPGNVTYKIILQAPDMLRSMLAMAGPQFDKQYLLLDYGELFKMPGIGNTVGDMLKNVENSKGDLQKWSDDLAAEIEAGLNVQTIEPNHYKLTLDDAAAKGIIIKVFDSVISLFSDKGILSSLLKTSLSGVDAVNPNTGKSTADEAMAQVMAQVPKIENIIKNVKMFTGDGIVYEYKLNNSGYATYKKLDMSLQIDAVDWIKQIGAEYPSMKDSMPQTDLVINAKIGNEMNFKNINAAGPIAFPALTADNSVDIYKLAMDQMNQTSTMTAVMSYEPIKVFADGAYVNFPDAKPVIVKNRTMVPARALFETLGGSVEYGADNGVQTVTGTLGGNTVKLVIGSGTAYVNGEPIALDSPAYITGGRTMVPLRFVSENFGFTVDYKSATGENAPSYNCDVEIDISSAAADQAAA